MDSCKLPVPQGSVLLGPLLCLICINDLPDQTNSICKICADDSLYFPRFIFKATLGMHKTNYWAFQ